MKLYFALFMVWVGGICIGIGISPNIVGVDINSKSYKQGQIDAQKGIVHYKIEDDKIIFIKELDK